MPSRSLLTAEDLDEIGSTRFGTDDPLGLAAELIDAVDQGRLADPADAGYALILGAELTARTGDLTGALALAERADEAYQRHRNDDDRGYVRAFRADMLLRLGREQEGFAELTRLRRLLIRDPNAASYVTDVLEANGQAEVAEQWLTAALETLRDSDEPPFGEGRNTGMVIYALAQQRHRIRRDLDLPHDEHDDLADNLAADDDLTDEDLDPAILFWPRAEFEELLTRWPELAEEYGASWEEHRDAVQSELLECSDAGYTGIGTHRGRVADLVEYATLTGQDPADPDVQFRYAGVLPILPWPPGRNDPCWCGSGAKYKKCCLARARA